MRLLKQSVVHIKPLRPELEVLQYIQAATHAFPEKPKHLYCLHIISSALIKFVQNWVHEYLKQQQMNTARQYFEILRNMHV